MDKKTLSLPQDITKSLHDIRAGEQFGGERVDHYHAVYERGHGPYSGVKVLMKRYRIFIEPRTGKEERVLPTVLRHLWRDIRQWKTLKHTNVLPFLGTTTEPYPCLVVPPVKGGNLGSFLQNSPDTDKWAMILGIAQGLHYLHTRNPPVFHGRLRDTNILIDDNGRPMLADYGLSELEYLYERQGQTALNALFNMRWHAPEFFDGDSLVNDISSEKVTRLPADVWRFGMVVYMILSGNPPYHTFRNITSLILAITRPKPELPVIPAEWYGLYGGYGAALVQMMEKCWIADAARRRFCSTGTYCRSESNPLPVV